MSRASPIFKNFSSKVGTMLARGKIGVILTDTVYGIVGSARSKKTVQRMYELKGRTETKPFIVLMASLGELVHFDIKFTPAEKKMLARAWNPHSRRPTSVILPVVWKKAWYLHRGTERFRFRIPRDAALRRLLKKTGPLVAPSANPQGLPTAGNIKEAVAYFGGDVDFYVDGGTRRGRASRLIEIHPDGKVEVIRK